MQVYSLASYQGLPIFSTHSMREKSGRPSQFCDVMCHQFYHGLKQLSNARLPAHVIDSDHYHTINFDVGPIVHVEG